MNGMYVSRIDDICLGIAEACWCIVVTLGSTLYLGKVFFYRTKSFFYIIVYYKRCNKIYEIHICISVSNQ